MSVYPIYSIDEKETLSTMFNLFPKVGKEFTVPETKEKYIIRENNINEVTVNIRSWVGNGGDHLNCSIDYSPVYVSSADNKYSRISGYLGGLDINTSLQINLERLVTQKDLDNRYQNWGSYHIGSTTTRYNSIDDLAYDLEVVLIKYFPKNIIINYRGNETHTVKSVLKLRNIILKDWEPYDEEE